MGDEQLSGPELELYNTVKRKLTESKEMNKLKAKMQSNILEIICGGKNVDSIDNNRDPRIKMANQLIMEYFHWYGYKYTAEMYAMESGCEIACPDRNEFENIIGEPEIKSIPALLEIVINLMKSSN